MNMRATPFISYLANYTTYHGHLLLYPFSLFALEALYASSEIGRDFGQGHPPAPPHVLNAKAYCTVCPAYTLQR